MIIDELITALENAGEGSRELDRAIFAEVFGRAGLTAKDPLLFTRSLDAALMLIPERDALVFAL